MQESHTTASLRGIDYVGGGVAWASGTGGTVLRTVDMGKTWTKCAVPEGAEKLDFRGVQAFDAQTAIVMSSGPGDLSRLYKTGDGCATWKLVFTNPDKDGFWDAVLYLNDFETIFILGDPVHGAFRLFSASVDEDRGTIGRFESNWNDHPLAAEPGEAAFAASNSLIAYNVGDGMFSFITGGSRSEVIHEEHGIDLKKGMFSDWSRRRLPFRSCESCGAYSIAAGPIAIDKSKPVVVVGGDYRRPNDNENTAAFSSDWGNSFHSSSTMPGGYRSSVG